MINIKDLAGKWEGSFTYGYHYPVEYLSKKEHFRIELVVEDEILKGTCTDSLSQEYFDQPATIEGSFIDGDICFIKKYPALLAVDENDNMFVDHSKPSLEIHYTGRIRRTLFSARYFFEGRWKIHSSYLDENMQENYYTTDGDWEMVRAK